MCVTLATALTVASTAVSAAGAIMQGQQANAAAQAQAAAYEQQQQNEQKSAAFEAAQQDRKQRLEMANARAQIGASGVGFAGSPSAVLAANAGQAQLDLEAIRYGSQLRQNQLGTQANLSRLEGRQARTASFINAGSAVLSGAVKLGQNPFK